jgi:hypothetical protein
MLKFPGNFDSEGEKLMRPVVLSGAAILVLIWGTACLAQTSRATVLAPQFQITDCSSPVQANVAGATYTVMNDLSFAPNDCIDVTAAGITINLNGHVLTASPCSCSGVSVARDAIGTHILGGGTISGRGPEYGIHDMGSFAVIENVMVNSQSYSGIFLDAVQGSIVKAVTVQNSLGTAGSYETSGGIQLSDTNHCVVEDSVATYNGQPFTCSPGAPCSGANTSGIFVGNSGSQALSANNALIGNQVNNNVPLGISVGGTGNVITGNTANANSSGEDASPYGIGIFVAQSGSPGPVANNVLIDNVTSQNQTDDLSDSNALCGTDHWILNTFTTRNLACVH